MGTIATSAPAATITMSGCTFPDWVTGRQYAAGIIVRFAQNGLLYRANFANSGFTPTISAYFWEAYACATGSSFRASVYGASRWNFR